MSSFYVCLRIKKIALVLFVCPFCWMWHTRIDFCICEHSGPNANRCDCALMPRSTRPSLEAAISYWCSTYPTAEGCILLEDSNFHLQFLSLCAVALNLNFTEQYSTLLYCGQWVQDFQGTWSW